MSHGLCDTVASGPESKKMPCGPNVVLCMGFLDSLELSHAKINLGIPLTELSSAACAIFNCPGLMWRSRLDLWKLGKLRLGLLRPADPGAACWGVRLVRLVGAPMVGREMQISSEGVCAHCLINFKDFGFIVLFICVRVCACVCVCMYVCTHSCHTCRGQKRVLDSLEMIPRQL